VRLPRGIKARRHPFGLSSRVPPLYGRWAIQQVADRIDGRPAQESTVNIQEKREASDWTREELMAILSKHVKRDDEAKPTAPSADSLN
jgi:hypothetical protein